MNDIDKIHDRINAVMRELVRNEARLTALESRTCAAAAPATSRPNVEPAASAGGSTGPASGGSAASSAGSTAGSLDLACSAGSVSRTEQSPSSSSPSDCTSGGASSDLVSAAIRDARESAMRAAVEREPVWTKQAGETAWDRWYAIYLTLEMDSEQCVPNAFNAWFASEVAAAKAKPHAETAEEVADKVMQDFGYRARADSTERAMILAAIKRERGEA